MVKECENCKYVDKREYEEPCKRCRNTRLVRDPSRNTTPFLWEEQESEGTNDISELQIKGGAL